ncbi:hypothetical protein [Nannocystis pusilla]|uniref:hypothetical protein n=1 Tax=Nannocystis pusilla TaxID=889268 RepID=UPI003B77DBCE
MLALAHCPVFDAPLNHALARLSALAGGAGGFAQVLRLLRRGEVHLLSDGAAVVVGIPGSRRARATPTRPACVRRSPRCSTT